MRGPARIPEVLAAIRAAWEQQPDQRLFQLLINAVGARPNPLFVVEDEVLLRAIRRETRPSPSPTTPEASPAPGERSPLEVPPSEHPDTKP